MLKIIVYIGLRYNNQLQPWIISRITELHSLLKIGMKKETSSIVEKFSCNFINLFTAQ
jgi:hypothetical protein